MDTYREGESRPAERAQRRVAGFVPIQGSRPGSLHRRLAVLVAGAVLPVLILAGVIVYSAYVRTREDAGARILQGAISAMAAVDRELQNQMSALQILSLEPELVARGLVEAREREGVFVLAANRTSAPTPIVRVPLPQLVPPPLTRPDLPGRGMTALSTVFIDPELLPTERIAECARSVLREKMPAQYEAQGYRPLREAIAKRLTARGMDVDADDVIITTGSQQSLDIVARSLATKRVAVESPVYAYAKLLFESLGNELVGMKLDQAPCPNHVVVRDDDDVAHHTFGQPARIRRARRRVDLTPALRIRIVAHFDGIEHAVIGAFAFRDHGPPVMRARRLDRDHHGFGA